MTFPVLVFCLLAVGVALSLLPVEATVKKVIIALVLLGVIYWLFQFFTGHRSV